MAISVVGFIIYKFIRMKKEECIQKDIKKIEDIEEFQSMNYIKEITFIINIFLSLDNYYIYIKII